MFSLFRVLYASILSVFMECVSVLSVFRGVSVCYQCFGFCMSLLSVFRGCVCEVCYQCLGSV